MKAECQLAVVLPSAGLGQRLPGATKKQFRKIAEKEVFIHTLEKIFRVNYLKQIIIVISSDDVPYIKRRMNAYFPAQENMVHYVEGGSDRQESVRNGLKGIAENMTHVAIHDMVRPFVSVELFNQVTEKAIKYGSAILAMKAKDTIKKVVKNNIVNTINREQIYLAQTPQTFQRDLIIDAHRKCQSLGKILTDDAQAIEEMGGIVEVVDGVASNIKITTPEDLFWAEVFLKKQN